MGQRFVNMTFISLLTKNKVMECIFRINCIQLKDLLPIQYPVPGFLKVSKLTLMPYIGPTKDSQFHYAATVQIIFSTRYYCPFSLRVLKALSSS